MESEKDSKTEKVKSHKNYLLAATGIVILLGSFVLSLPRRAQGEADQGGPTKPVEVVNTAAEPVPVTGSISGSVKVINTPNVHVTNPVSLAGGIEVGITGTPTVKLDPNGNNVTVAPRGTIKIFDTGLTELHGGPRIVQYSVDVSLYSKVRVMAFNDGPGETDFACDSNVGDHFFGTFYPLGGAHLNQRDRFNEVYEVAGETLRLRIEVPEAGLIAQVVVFGN